MRIVCGDRYDSKSSRSTTFGLTRMPGTLHYMSPEQLTGKPLDGRSDIYTLGVLAYEMITCALPFPDATGPAALVAAHRARTPVPPSQLRHGRDLPHAVNDVVLKCLARDKHNRYADVTQLAAALQALIAMYPAP
jgi:serine/threonine-protein kinase